MFNFLKHLLVPHEKNNHRAKILHNSSLFLIILFLVAASIASYFIKVSKPDILGVSYSISGGELLNLVNQRRQENGLAPLALDATLDDAARRKAADMLSKNYWAHFAPDGSTSPWDFIRQSGYNYTFAGENLAKGFTDSGSVVAAWMSSPSHRDNILSNRYRDVGFAIVPGTISGEETVLIVEMFGSRTSQTLAAVPQTSVAAAQAPTPPSPTPTVVVVQVAELVPTKAEQRPVLVNRPKVDAVITTRAASTVGLSFLAFAFLMDMLIVKRKKIPRFVGHNLDHVILILLFMLFIVLKSRGVII